MHTFMAPERITSQSAAARFGGVSSWLDADGPLHVIDFGGGGGGARTFVLVHGFGGSYLDWTALVPGLRPHGRVLALDLPAFGLSPASGRTGDVADSSAVVARFLTEYVGSPVILVGNSMGGMIAALAADRVPAMVEGLVLFGAALPAPGARLDPRILSRLGPAALPGLGPRMVRVGRRNASSAVMVKTFVDYCFADTSRVPHDYRTALAELLSFRRRTNGNDRAVARAARSTLNRVFLFPRYDAVLDRLPMPVLLVHGAEDRLVPVSAARRARRRRPGWEVHILPGVGHTAQLEVPELSARLINEWLIDVPVAAR
jgi:pimeloyl-ACP methyl ester carboxylesterase